MRRKWSEQEIEVRHDLINYFVRHLKTQLVKANPAFKFYQTETPVIVSPPHAPVELRQSTNSGSYEFAQELLKQKHKLPMVIWQTGKTFDTKKSLADHNSLEFELLYSPGTVADYMPIVAKTCKTMLTKQCGKVSSESDQFTSDLTGRELIKINQPTVAFAKNIEIVVNLDHCVECFLRHEHGGGS